MSNNSVSEALGASNAGSGQAVGTGRKRVRQSPCSHGDIAHVCPSLQKATGESAQVEKSTAKTPDITIVEDEDDDKEEPETADTRIYDPIPVKRIMKSTGRPRDELADEITVLCYNEKKPDHKRWLCVGWMKGCRKQWAVPRITKRVEKHGKGCRFLDNALKQKVARAVAQDSPGARLEQHEAAASQRSI
jgi:hypothetical protein